MNRGSSHKSRDVDLRFELPQDSDVGELPAICGVRDFKTLGIYDLRFGALGWGYQLSFWWGVLILSWRLKNYQYSTESQDSMKCRASKVVIR